MINYIYCNTALSVTQMPKIMASLTLPCNFYDRNVVYYVLVSLLVVNNFWYYVFNGNIFCSTINRENFCTTDLLVLLIDFGEC